MPQMLFDFRDPQAVTAWAPIDDRVMGGLSRSRLRHNPAGHAVFEGEVSLARQGGFASVRSTAAARGWAGAEVCLVELLGDGRPYKLSLLVDDGFDSQSYQAGLHPVGPGWQTLTLPIAAFRASFRGRELAAALPLDPSAIRQVGLMTADRQAGPFTLAIRMIGLA